MTTLCIQDFTAGANVVPFRSSVEDHAKRASNTVANELRMQRGITPEILGMATARAARSVVAGVPFTDAVHRAIVCALAEARRRIDSTPLEVA